MDTGCRSPFNTNIERFTPPYLESLNSSRAEIVSYPKVVTHSSIRAIGVNNPTGIKRVTFIRYSSTTHSTNTDQRFFELEIIAINRKNVIVRFPPSNVAVPGPYHLFLIDSLGIPSVAAIVMIKRGPVYIEMVSTDSGGFVIHFFVVLASYIWWLI